MNETPQNHSGMNVRVAEPQEQDWFDKLLNKHHYLGAAKAVSATLRQVGMSQGYSRHRTDFYVPNDSPKKLWMYDLSGSGRKEITAVTLAPEHQGASIPQPGGVLPLDGKMIRDAIGVLTLAAHEDGSPQGMAVYDQKEGSGRSEQSAARQALAKMGRLDEKIITADALHCQRDLAASIVQQGGDYLLQIKGNQPAVLAQAQALDTCMDPPFSKKPKTRTDA